MSFYYATLMCKCVCITCGDTWEAHPASQHTPYCPACAQVMEWERQLRNIPGKRLARALQEICAPLSAT